MRSKKKIAWLKFLSAISLWQYYIEEYSASKYDGHVTKRRVDILLVRDVLSSKGRSLFSLDKKQPFQE